MTSHVPEGYKCPICLGLQGIENGNTLLKQSDEVYKDDLVTGYINSFWIPTCEGHVIIVPNDHFENIFDLPHQYGHRIFEVTKRIAVAMKQAYKCDGITIKQNNETAGGQHAFHYHLHVYPRYQNDQFDENSIKEKVLSDPADRIQYAEKLKKYL